MDGTGIIYLQFDVDCSLTSASVIAPLGDKIAGGLNTQMAAAGINQLMDLNVVKKVCRGSVCMCFEGNNTVRKATDDSDAQQFLQADTTWKLATAFS